MVLVPDSLQVPVLAASSQVASARPAQASREKPHKPIVLEMRDMTLEYEDIRTHGCMQFTPHLRQQALLYSRHSKWFRLHQMASYAHRKTIDTQRCL